MVAESGPAEVDRRVFVNWMSANDISAVGRLGDRLVTMVGSLGPGSVVDGRADIFRRPMFTPLLEQSDAVNIVAVDGNAFHIYLSAPLINPVLHFASLRSTIAFGGIPLLERLSGDANFRVLGTTVAGEGRPDEEDANGTVQIVGEVTGLDFTARPNFVGGSSVDGIYLQLGGRLPDT